jgi:pimeloyl-ACP methyl ester carboxylesterase
MQIIDRGSGVPVVMVPGIQGRWEWMASTVDALATCCRIITFSLCDEPSSGFPSDPARGVENFLMQIEQVLDRAGLQKIVLMGVSYGGPLATEFAVRYPERVQALILVSALPPDWEPDRRAKFYLRAPLLLSPVFFIDAPIRAQREIRAALPRLPDRVRFSVQQLRTLLKCFISPHRMATRIHWLAAFQFSDPSQLRHPALIITGEPGLDRVVRPELTRRYLSLLPHARFEVLHNTGHLGVSTRPEAFASLVRHFLTDVVTDARRATA